MKLNDKAKTHLNDTVGPLIGHSSDGNSRLCKLMLNLASDRASESKYKPVPLEDGFIFSARIDDNNLMRDMCNQDMIHNHRKIINALDQVKRDLMYSLATIQCSPQLPFCSDFD